MCYIITNPLHYIAANNTEETIDLLVKYGFPEPASECELYDFVSKAASEHGDRFVLDITALHPDKEMLLETLADSKFNGDDYKGHFALASVDAINLEIQFLRSQLSAMGPNGDELAVRNIKDKIEYLRTLLESKNKNTALVVPQPNQVETIHKTNQYILIALAALALMYFGSKIFR